MHRERGTNREGETNRCIFRERELRKKGREKERGEIERAREGEGKQRQS